MKKEFEDQITVLPCPKVSTLCWSGDNLVDWTHCRTYTLDGDNTPPKIGFGWGFPFDSATCSPDGRWAAVYQRLGTKALLLRDGEFVRELNRAYYHADVYEYPLVFFNLPDGREVLAHCPDDYREIEIEECASGARLSKRETDSQDYFHSRLAVNASGTKLLSAGWIWHPSDVVCMFDVVQALSRPVTLSEGGFLGIDNINSEVNSAAFFATDKENERERLVLASSPQASRYRNREFDNNTLAPGTIGILDIETSSFVSVVPFNEPVGTMMPIDDKHVIGFYEHPKLINIFTGEVLKRWENLDTGFQNSSIIMGLDEPVPPIACDIQNHRFAVAGEEKITVVTLT